MGGNKIYGNTFIGGHFGIDVAGHFNVKGASAFSWDIYDNVFQWAANRNYLSVGDFGSISIEGATAYLYIHNNHFKNVPVAINSSMIQTCLLYTSDAADDLLCVDLGGRRIIKKKKQKKNKQHINSILAKT